MECWSWGGVQDQDTRNTSRYSNVEQNEDEVVGAEKRSDNKTNSFAGTGGLKA